MEKSPLAVPFRLAMLSKTLDRMVAKSLTPGPLAFPRFEMGLPPRASGGGDSEALNDLIETDHLCAMARQSSRLERMWVQLDRLASTLGGREPAQVPGYGRPAPGTEVRDLLEGAVALNAGHRGVAGGRRHKIEGGAVIAAQHAGVSSSDWSSPARVPRLLQPPAHIRGRWRWPPRPSRPRTSRCRPWRDAVEAGPGPRRPLNEPSDPPVEHAEMAGEALGDDQGGTVVGDHGSVGEGQIACRLVAGAVGIHSHQRRGTRRRCGRPFRRRGHRGRSRSSRRTPARGGHHEVVGVVRSPRGAGLPWGTSEPSASRRSRTRSSRELMRRRPSGSHPSPAGSPSNSTSVRSFSLGRDGEDAMIEEVRIPQATVVPTRAFTEVQSRDEWFRYRWLVRTSRRPPPDAPGPAPQFTTGARGVSPGPCPHLMGWAPVATAPQGVAGLRWACDVLGAQRDPQPGVLHLLEDKGGRPGEHSPSPGPPFWRQTISPFAIRSSSRLSFLEKSPFWPRRSISIRRRPHGSSGPPARSRSVGAGGGASARWRRPGPKCSARVTSSASTPRAPAPSTPTCTRGVRA